MLHRDSFDPRGHIAEGAPLARVGSGHQVKGARAKAGKLLSAMWRGVGYEPNRRINPMHLDMHRAKRCGARTRSGKPCPSPAMANGTCRMHGGPSPGAPLGNRHAQKHGRHTAEAIARRREISALIQVAVALGGKAIVRTFRCVPMPAIPHAAPENAIETIRQPRDIHELAGKLRCQTFGITLREARLSGQSIWPRSLRH
jgi:hypothetical protein